MSADFFSSSWGFSEEKWEILCEQFVTHIALSSRAGENKGKDFTLSIHEPNRSISEIKILWTEMFCFQKLNGI